MKLRWLLHPLTVVFPTLGTLQTFPLSNRAEVWFITNNFECLFTRRSIHPFLLPFDRAGSDTKQTKLQLHLAQGFLETVNDHVFACCTFAVISSVHHEPVHRSVSLAARHGQQLTRVASNQLLLPGCIADSFSINRR